MSDAVAIAQRLIQHPSVTPIDQGALTYLGALLTDLGFVCHHLTFEEPDHQPVQNLYARYGRKAPHFCFAGHTDVVAPGPLEAWSHHPFDGIIQHDFLIGRGAVDMKGAIAAFVDATKRFLEQTQGTFAGSISFLITGDEEGIAINGTKKVLEWMQQQGEVMDFCLVGEPSSQHAVGDTIKIGRRGSLNTALTVTGVQGHVAFPERAKNPIHALIDMLAILKQGPQETSSDHFDPSHLEITSIDVGNETVNVIPQSASARFNIRFNDQQTGEQLQRWIQEVAKASSCQVDLKFQLSGEADVCEPTLFLKRIQDIIHTITKQTPTLTTAGGTSDARFIRQYCPAVFELGLVGQTMHQIDERVAVQDLETLSQIYFHILTEYFSSPAIIS